MGSPDEHDARVMALKPNAKNSKDAEKRGKRNAESGGNTMEKKR